MDGPLGSGKTTLARGLIKDRLGEAGRHEEIVSPTFTLVQTYETPTFDIYHYDLYRVEREIDVLELGFDDALEDGVTLVEWPDRLGRLLPEDRLEVRLSGSGDRRRAEVIGHGAWAERVRIMVLEGAGHEELNG